MTATTTLVRPCKAGLHDLEEGSGQCLPCRRERERVKKNAQSDERRKMRGLEPARMCGRKLHKMEGSNLAVEVRRRIDGTPYEIVRCYACSTMRNATRKASRDRSESQQVRAAQRQADAIRIGEIEIEILAMCDQMDLASKYELSLLKSRREALVKERDKLEKESVAAALRKGAVAFYGEYLGNDTRSPGVKQPTA